MPIYRYNAMDSNGKKIKGEIYGDSKEEVIYMIRQRGEYPINILNESIGEDRNIKNPFGRIKIKDLAVFCRQFHTMLNAGIPIINCLNILGIQTENNKLKKTIEDVYEYVQKGATFSESLGKHREVFPELLINMIEAGEVSGNLDVIMDRMAFHYEKENKINNKVKNALVYPLLLSIVAIIVVVFLLTVVMPTFIGMFSGSGLDLPFPTRLLLYTSDIIKGYWYILISMSMIMIYMLKRFINMDKGRLWLDSIKLKIPIVKGVIEKIVISRFTRTLSTLISSGVPLIHSLDIVSRVVGNKLVCQGILNAKEAVRKGTELSKPIGDMNIFPPMVESMIHVGEESGALDEILDKTADFYDEEVESALQKMTTLLEPLMIMFMALIIGAIVIAIVLPMFDMINTIQY